MRHDLNEYIGRAVRHELWERRITQRALADALGVNESAVSRLLRGGRKWEVSEVLIAAEVLGVAVSDLLPEGMRQNLVSVTSGDPDSVTRGIRDPGWFRSKRAKPRRTPHHGALFPPGSPDRVTLLRPTG
jgi:transcriptional regulator with XRE-family HTH domain